MKNYKVIDTKNWIRNVQFEWFNSFDNPCFGFDVKIDVTEIVNYSKETKTKFFTNFFYVVMRANNECEPMRLRYIDGEVRLYDVINPDFTIKTIDGCFNNACFDYTSNYEKFYKECRTLIEQNCEKMNHEKSYNDATRYDKIYCSCLTTIDVVGMIHPIKYADKNSTSVPRIFWSKYLEENGKYFLVLNTTVSHALMDGEQLSAYFNLVRKYSKEFRDLIK